jgi:diacylglycerol kinase family enzyme
VIARGRERAIDVAEVDGTGYLGILSAGLDSDVQAIVNSTRVPLDELVYVYGVVRALAGWRPARWDVEIDGSARSFTGYSVAVANTGMFGGGMKLAPDAKLDDGLLDVVMIRDCPKRHLLAVLPKVFNGTHVSDDSVEIVRGREIAFRADRPFAAYADGDPLADLPATVRVRAGGLRVLAPKVVT